MALPDFAADEEAFLLDGIFNDGTNSGASGLKGGSGPTCCVSARDDLVIVRLLRATVCRDGNAGSSDEELSVSSTERFRRL